ncbi:YihY/virulence factor BrkB family protein [Thiothrix lacustris]|uniref:YihY/virulence factor BrkB family protein n=1 Tax=Thiothrix lacustris TaxID=525917 RepID=UPI0027E4F817|nr:YihY/virulence factor BrkB family protein [Thiothrix lacustris]WMP16677.1 YihY/virulence factor BrkB family protein [Thiothrix lacustris]
MLKKLLIFIRALAVALFHDMHQGSLTLRAMGLVYTTLLSLVPLLALSFSVLKGFGVHNQMQPFLLRLFAPMGSKAEELTTQVLGFVDNVQVGVLGFAGLTILLYTVVSLMGKIEEAFNHVWRVRKPRSIVAQFRDYLSMVLVGPILIVSALGVWSSLGNLALLQTIAGVEPLGVLLNVVVQISPTVLIVLAFFFVYLLMPNTRVQPLAALGGAVLAGLAWQVAGWVFASFVVSSGQQTAIYSIFASLFLFMLWLYVGWIIVLTGARLAYYFQHPDAVYLPQQPTETSVQTREMLAAVVLREIGERFLNKQEPATLDVLSRAIPVSRLLLEDLLEDLMEYGILSRDDDDPAHYLLRVSPAKLTVAEIRHCFWQGNHQQQRQARQIQRQTGLADAWLADVAAHQQMSISELLAEASAASPDQTIAHTPASRNDPSSPQ